MKHTLLVLLSFIVLGCVDSSMEGEIPLVSLNKETGQSSTQFISSQVFVKKVSPLISGVSRQVTQVLENRTLSPMDFGQQAPPWELSRVTVGLKLESEFGVLNHALELESEAEVELRFQKI